jgi:hypothetical protein
LPGGESCSEVIVLAVRFQNLVSFAEAPVEISANMTTDRKTALTMMFSLQSNPALAP